jgi:hypothetical protein
MTSAEVVPARSLRAGDLVTETDTPSGPWYAVLNVKSDRLTVDGSTQEDEPLPVVLPLRPGDMVLRRLPC